MDFHFPGFEMGDDVVRRSYCTATGLLANSGCSTSTGWYKIDSLPGVCSGCGGGGPSGGDGPIVDPGYDIPEF